MGLNIGGAAQGAAAGAQFGPWGSGLGAVAGLFSGGGGGANSPAGPSSSDQVGSGSMFDNSGWTVATNGSTATATRGADIPWLWLAGAAVVALYLLKK